MEIHLIQHGLSDLHSHYFNETLAWRETMRKAGRAWHCYSHVSLSLTHSIQTGAVPAFRLTTDVVLEADHRLAPLADFIDVAESFADDCNRALRKNVHGNDLVVIPYTTEREIFGTALWLERQRRSARPRLAFIVHRPDLNWSFGKDRAAFDGDMSYWRYAGKRLALATGGQIPFIGARDMRLQSLLQNMLRMDVRHVPMSTFGWKLPDGVADAAKEFDLGMVGQFRPERGSHYIPKILLEIVAEYPRFRFLLQVSNTAEQNAISRLFSEAGRQDCVEFVVGDQTTEAFLRSVARCRMLVLPYVPDRYRMRSSGILSVATGLAVPVIVPGTTWLSDRIDEGSVSGFVYEDLTAGFIERVLNLPKSERDLVQQKAVTLAEPWRQRNATTTVLGQILAFCQEQEGRG